MIKLVEKRMGFITRFLLFAIIITISFVNPISSKAYDPTQYGSVAELFEAFGHDDFKLINKSPLHFSLSPSVVKGEPNSLVEETVRREMLYGIMWPFIHTNVEAVTVTVIPNEMTITSPITYRQLNSYRGTSINLLRPPIAALGGARTLSYHHDMSRVLRSVRLALGALATVNRSAHRVTISKTRQEVLALLKKHVGVNTFSDLAADFRVGTTVIPNQSSNKMKRITYDDQGPPGLTRFFGYLRR